MKEYNIINIMAQEGLEKAIEHYGLEGTDEAIKRAYKLHPAIQKLMLDKLWKKIK